MLASGWHLLSTTFVQSISRATDRKSLIVKKLANSTNQQDFVMLVIATIPPPLDWLELVELLFPVAQDMGFDPTQLANFTNGEIALGGNRRQFVARMGFRPLFHRRLTQRQT